MTGWFAVKRGITKHPIFREQPVRLAIWIWLIDNAAWEDTPHDINGKIVTIPRGSVCVSERRLADAIGVGRQVVRTFFDLLEANHMVNPDVTHGRTILALCNYEKYQASPSRANPANNPRLTQGQPTKGQVYNSVSKDTGAEAAPDDPKAVMFTSGKAILMKAGMSKASAGSMMGKWVRDHGDVAVMAAIGQAMREGAVDPVPYIQRCLLKKAKQAEPEVGDTRTLPNGTSQTYVGPFDGWMTVRQ